MDYKEKYEKALEWMKSIYPTMQGSDKEDAEHYFPELALSEDEKMIIGLQGFLSAYGSDYFGTDGWQKFADWLEKQKEQKPVENGGKELLYVSNKSYNIGYRDGKMAAEQKTAKWSEEDERRRDGIIQWLREYQAKFNPKYDSLSIESIESLIDWFESLRPQPKQEWSEEDEKLLDSWLDVIDSNDWRMDENFCKASREFINRLKSQKL